MSILCAGLVAAIMAAPSGGTVTLAPGQECGRVLIRNRAAPVEIVAAGSTVRQLAIYNSQGITWTGGTLKGPNPPLASTNYAVDIRASANVTIRLARIEDASRGVVASVAPGLAVLGNRIEARSDGVNIAEAHGARIEGNSISIPNPLPPLCTYPDGRMVDWTGKQGNLCRADGGLWTDGDHADCVQWVNRASNDVLVRHNICTGKTQGFGSFLRSAGTEATGHRNRIVGNFVQATFSNAITLGNCVNCEVTGNVVRRAPGGATKPNITFGGSMGGRFCGNDVEGHTPPAALPCAPVAPGPVAPAPGQNK